MDVMAVVTLAAKLREKFAQGANVAALVQPQEFAIINALIWMGIIKTAGPVEQSVPLIESVFKDNAIVQELLELFVMELVLT